MVTKGVNESNAGIMSLATSAMAKKQGQSNADGAQSFQKVFDRQTGKGAEQVGNKPGSSEKYVKKKTTGQAERLNESKSKLEAGNRTQEEELKEPSEVNEAAAAATQELMLKMADLFQVSLEDIQASMKELGLEPADLLSEMELKQMAMALGGAENPLDLLTDGELFGKLQELLEFRQEALEGAGGDLQLEAEEFLKSIRTGSDPEGNNPGNDVFQGVDSAAKPQVMASRDAGEGGREEGGEQQDDETGNLVLQQTLQEAEELTADSAMEKIDGPQRADTEMIMRQILTHLKAQLKPEVSSLEMQLHPASLGNLQVQLTSKGGAVTAQFFAQNEAVKAALETQMIQLKESFDEQGIKVDAIEVAVQTHQFEQNLEEQGRGRQEQQAPRSRGSRRLRIDEPLTPEQLDELTQDDRIAAEMLQAGGGTVDFTA